MLRNVKSYLKKYKIPSNCTESFVSKVNSEIWGNLSANSKRSDIRMLVLQDTLLKVSSALVVTVDDLLSHREKKTPPNYKTLIPRLTDSVALIGACKQRTLLQTKGRHSTLFEPRVQTSLLQRPQTRVAFIW